MKKLTLLALSFGLIAIMFSACSTDFPFPNPGGPNGNDTLNPNPWPSDTANQDTVKPDPCPRDTIYPHDTAISNEFLKIHYPNTPITGAAYEFRLEGDSPCNGEYVAYYVVYLVDSLQGWQTIIEFNLDGTWTKIDKYPFVQNELKEGLPNSVINLLSAKILNYIHNNYSDWIVVGMTNGEIAGQWSVTLQKIGQNSWEHKTLIFSKDGAFMGTKQ